MRLIDLTRLKEFMVKTKAGLVLFIVVFGIWIILMSPGPINFMNNWEYLLMGDITQVKGTLTFDTPVTLNKITNILGITGSAGSTKWTTRVPEKDFLYLKSQCENRACRAEAEFNYNELDWLLVYNPRDGSVLTELNNHTRRTDDIKWTIIISSSWVVVTVILFYWINLYFKSLAKSPATNSSATGNQAPEEITNKSIYQWPKVVPLQDNSDKGNQEPE